MMLAVPYNFQFSISQFFQSSINVALARLVPITLFRYYFYILGIFYLAIRSDLRQRVAAGVCANLPRKEPWPWNFYLLWKTYLGIFEHYFEKMINAYHPTERLERYLCEQSEIHNEGWLMQATLARRGVLMVSGHFGAVEYLPLFLALQGYQPAIIMRFKTARLRQECLARCRQFDVQAIDADQPNAALRALKAVKQGRILITLCDEFTHWRPHRDRYIDVLGRRVQLDRTLDVLYRRYRPASCLGIVKRNKGGFTLHIEPITDGDEPISLAERAWRLLEPYILRFPDQWYQWREVAERLAAYEQQDTPEVLQSSAKGHPQRFEATSAKAGRVVPLCGKGHMAKLLPGPQILGHAA
ncbi:MAG: hypothetical protein QNJ61_06665 [Desulfobacterales bacterium]|nr:hypothetical protein [Desulfobacterales bacterium]